MAVEVTTDIVKDYFTSIADDLVKLNGDNLQEIGPGSPHELAQFLIKHANIQEGDVVLDAGSGTGYVDILITQQFSRTEITALDICPEFNAIAEKNIVRSGADRLRFKIKEGDFTKLTTLFEPNTFDKILFSESILYSPSLPTTLRGVKSILKPTGQIFIKDNFCLDLAEDRQLFQDFYTFFRQHTLRNIIPFSQFVNQLEMLGFVVRGVTYESDINPIRLPNSVSGGCEEQFKKIASKMLNVYINDDITDVIAFQPMLIVASNTFIDETISNWSFGDTVFDSIRPITQ